MGRDTRRSIASIPVHSGCHTEIYDEWKTSAHRYAAMDPIFQGIQNVMAKQGQRFANAVKNVDWLLLMLRSFMRRAYYSVRLVSKVCSQLSVCGHHLAR